MNKNLPSTPSPFLLYTAADGKIKVDVFIKDETVWLTQNALAELFGKERSVISKHLKSIFGSGELDEKSSVQKMHIAHSDKPVNYYNLDAIIAVGYRVNSYQATQFRIWATKTLKEFIIKGFVLDDERLKQGKTVFGRDYFEELLERIREIRASERRFYQKITDIYALASDYDKNSPITKEFFATVQNKLHWAIVGKTAAEIIYDSVDAAKIYMGLISWKHAPDGKVMKSDVSIAKNYLTEKEIKALDRITTMYLDYAEDQAEQNVPMTMKDWSAKLNVFLQFNNRALLETPGKVTQAIAKAFAESEFENYRIVQDQLFESDFDKMIKNWKTEVENRGDGKGD